jgi:hypothetical protein
MAVVEPQISMTVISEFMWLNELRSPAEAAQSETKTPTTFFVTVC